MMMKRRRTSCRALMFAVAVALILGCPPVRAQSVAPARLTLADAIAAAKENNSRLRDADSTLEQARIARDVARSAFRPKIVPNVLGAIGQPDLSSQSYGVNLSQRFTTGTEFDANVSTSASRNQLGTFYYTDTTFLLTQPIVGGSGRDAVRRDLTSAERQVDAADASRQLTEQRLIVDVATAYYTIVGQQQVVAVAEQARDQSARLLDVARAKLTIGKVSQLDVLRAQQLLREADSRVFDARAAADDARDQLQLLMGRTAEAPFDVDPDIPASNDPVDLDSAVQTALARRPDLRSARRAADAAGRMAETARRLPVPEFDVKLALTRREAAPGLRSSFGLDGFRIVPFAGISMPISRPGERETALLQQQRARDAADRLQTEIEIDVRRAVRQQARLAHALESADAAVGFARMEVDVASARYQRGLSNNLDLISAQTDLLAAQSRRIDALAALAVGRLNLQATMGALDGGSQ